jgi:hypothetical protein
MPRRHSASNEWGYREFIFHEACPSISVMGEELCIYFISTENFSTLGRGKGQGEKKTLNNKNEKETERREEDM